MDWSHALLGIFPVDHLKLCQAGLGHFQVFPEMVHWVRVTVLAVPLQHIHIVVPHTRLCCLAEQPSNKMDLQPSLSSWAPYISMFVYLRTPVSVPSTLGTDPVLATKKTPPEYDAAPKCIAEENYVSSTTAVECFALQPSRREMLTFTSSTILTYSFTLATLKSAPSQDVSNTQGWGYCITREMTGANYTLKLQQFFFPIWQPKNTSSSLLASAQHHSGLQLHTHAGTERMEM